MENLSYMNRSILFGNWTAGKIGNYFIITYYAGVEAGNPSGSTSNFKKISYYDNLGALQYVDNFTWNLDDNLISQTSTEI